LPGIRKSICDNRYNILQNSSFPESEVGPFDRYGQSTLLEDFLQTSCADVIKTLLGHFDSLLETYNNELRKHSWEKAKFGKETEHLVLAVDRYACACWP
jgi:hypothetical protein